MQRPYFVYILASESRELYIGVTNDLYRRVAEHRSGLGKTYAFQHGILRLVYYEHTLDPRAAIAREKELKLLNQQKKLALIEGVNREWRDLAEGEGASGRWQVEGDRWVEGGK